MKYMRRGNLYGIQHLIKSVGNIIINMLRSNFSKLGKGSNKRPVRLATS
jgi:hypothetical protein